MLVEMAVCCKLLPIASALQGEPAIGEISSDPALKRARAYMLMNLLANKERRMGSADWAI